jgi:selenocysteine lyase/cysteine desulfurase
VTLDDVAWAESPRRYEAGTPNLLGAVALGSSCDALSAYGMGALAVHERGLAGRLWAGLDAIDGVSHLRMWSDADDRVGVAAFTVAGWEAHDLGAHLADRGIAVRAGSFCAHPLVAHLIGVPAAHTASLLHEIECGGDVSIPGAVRASVGLGTTAADIDVLLEAVAACAKA